LQEQAEAFDVERARMQGEAAASLEQISALRSAAEAEAGDREKELMATFQQEETRLKEQLAAAIAAQETLTSQLSQLKTDSEGSLFDVESQLAEQQRENAKLAQTIVELKASSDAAIADHQREIEKLTQAIDNLKVSSDSASQGDRDKREAEVGALQSSLASSKAEAAAAEQAWLKQAAELEEKIAQLQQQLQDSAARAPTVDTAAVDELKLLLEEEKAARQAEQDEASSKVWFLFFVLFFVVIRGNNRLFHPKGRVVD